MAVSETGFRIILRAAQIRVDAGEDLEDVVNSYTKLSPEQVEELRASVVIDQ